MAIYQGRPGRRFWLAAQEAAQEEEHLHRGDGREGRQVVQEDRRARGRDDCAVQEAVRGGWPGRAGAQRPGDLRARAGVPGGVEALLSPWFDRNGLVVVGAADAGSSLRCVKLKSLQK